MTFTDTSSGTITNRLWDFGDGSTSNTTAVSLSHTYNNSGTNSVALTVTGPVGANTLIRANYVSVTNLPPFLSLSPTNLNFGPVITDTSSTQTFQIVNSGGLPLIGSASAIDPFFITAGSPFNLAPGQTGFYNNSVVFISNGGNSTNTVTALGWTPAQMVIAPLSYDFGIFAVGSNGQTVFAVSNVGDAPLSNGVVTIETGPFTLPSTTAFNLLGHTSTNIPVNFTPLAEGGFTNKIFFSASNNSHSTNSLSGTGAVTPSAGFSASPASGLWPLVATFTDGSTGTITNRFWDFGDGSTTNTTAISFTHTYASAGTNTVALTVTGPVGANTLTLPNYIAVTNLPPNLLVTPSSLAFGSVVIGQTNTLAFQVINTGGLTLTGSVSATLPFRIQNGSPFSVAPGQTNLLSVSFTPSVAGSFSNVVQFVSNGGNTAQTVTGTGLTPAQLAIIPSSLNFGTIAVGSNAQASFTINNLGGATLSNGVASVSGGPFTILSGTPFSLPGFSSTNLVVRFAPGSAASFSNVVVFTSGNDGSSTNSIIGIGAAIPVASFSGTPLAGLKPLTVTFTDGSTGTITNRFWDFGDGSTTNTSVTSFTHTYASAGTNTVALTVTGPVGVNTLTLPNYIAVTNLPPNLLVSPNALAFGSVVVGQTNTLSFQVINTGGLTLTGSVSTTAPFSIQSGSPFSVAPGQTNLLSVRFIPSAAGSFSNVVQFVSNAGTTAQTVTGTGLSPAQLAIIPSSLNFGTIAVGSNAQASFTMALTNGQATINGGPFTIISGTPFNLPGFGSTNVVIGFDPPLLLYYSNVVGFTSDNAGGSTNPISGTGGIAPTAIFTATPTSGLWPLTVTFNDNSSGTITSRFWDFGDGATTNTSATAFTHTYTSASTNTVTLTVSGPLGFDSDVQNGLIIVTNLPPKLLALPANINFGLLAVGQVATQSIQVINTGGLSLTGTASVGPPFHVLSGSPFTIAPNQSNLVSISFGPTNAGTFSDSVIFVSNGGDQTNGMAGTAAIIPIADFTGTPLSGNKPLNVLFTDTSVGTITNRLWNFGDGSTSNTTLSTVSHVYVNPGTNNVSLTVVGPVGTSAKTRTNYIAVLDQLMITSLKVTNANVLVSFNSQLGRYYRLEYSDMLGSAQWLIAADFIPGTGKIVNATDIGGAGHPSRFYRVKALTNADLVPIADFTADRTLGQIPLTVTFTDASTGLITNRLWTFGDGFTTNTTATTVSHTYAAAGTNTVSLTASGPSGVNTRTRSGYIVSTDQLIITSIKLSGADVLISFTSQPGNYYRVEYTTTLGSSNWVTAVDFVPGTGNVVTARDVGGANSSFRFYRVKQLDTVDLVPITSFTATPVLGTAPLKVTFSDTSTGLITNRLWNFGDGSTTNTTATTVVHTYTNPGSAIVSLTVSGPQGVSTQTRTNFITVSQQLIITSIQISGTNVIISFTSQAGQFYRVQYVDGLGSTNWLTAADFVPGTGGIAQGIHLGGATNPQRFYRVKLLTAADLIPAAAFSGTPVSGIAPMVVTFTDVSGGIITNRSWSFGDGTITNLTGTTVTHVYTVPGTNNVTLTVNGPQGSSTLSKTNYVNIRGSIRITSLRLNGANAIISFETAAGRFYRLEYTDSIGTGTWATAADNLSGTGGIITATDATPPTIRRFYRVKQLP